MTVSLVGAGPGHPGLLTRRGAELLGRADVVIYDRLVTPELLALARPDAELIDVGKAPGASTGQADINARLIELGRAGRDVVRFADEENFALYVRFGRDHGSNRAHSRCKERAVRREAIRSSHGPRFCARRLWGASDSRPELLDPIRFGLGAIIAGVKGGRDLFRVDEADVGRRISGDPEHLRACRSFEVVKRSQ